MFIDLKCHSFYNLFIFARTQGLAKLSTSLNKKRNDGRGGISIACCHSHLCYTSYVSIQHKRQAQHGLLSLLVHHRVFFSCWCTKRPSFPACAILGFLSLMVLYKFPTCHGNQTKWPLVLKHIYWVDNHQMIITAKYDFFIGYGENAI